jgi:hypothetical protein
MKYSQQFYPFLSLFFSLWIREPEYLSDTARGYRLDDRGFESRQRVGIFLFTTVSITVLGPTQPCIQRVPGALSLGVKRKEREFEYSPPSTAEVKNAWSYNSTPQYVFMRLCLVEAQGQLYLYLTSVDSLRNFVNSWRSCHLLIPLAVPPTQTTAGSRGQASLIMDNPANTSAAWSASHSIKYFCEKINKWNCISFFSACTCLRNWMLHKSLGFPSKVYMTAQFNAVSFFGG